MNQETGKPDRLKLAMGCSVAAIVFVSLIAVVVTAAGILMESVPKTPAPAKSDNLVAEPAAEKLPKVTESQVRPKKTDKKIRITAAPAPPDAVVERDVKLPAIERGEPLKPPEPAPQDALAPVIREPVAGSFPPALAMDTKGAIVDLDGYKGKVVFVDFWASWCDPYVRNLPRVKEAYAKYHAQGLEIVGVCLNDDPTWMSKFIQKNGMTWRQIQASDGYDSPTVVRWKVTDLPSAFIIGRDGKISQTGVAGENITRLIEVEMRR